MDAFQNLFLRKLAGRLNAEISKRTGEIIEPKSKPKDYAAFAERAAYINALRDVSEWMAEIESELNRPDIDQPNPARAVRQSRSSPYA